MEPMQPFAQELASPWWINDEHTQFEVWSTGPSNSVFFPQGLKGSGYVRARKNDDI